MDEFIIREEQFHKKILEKAPVADAGQCILLYRKQINQSNRDCMDESLLIDEGTYCSLGQLRRGGYNQKAILSLKPEKMHFTHRLNMKEKDYKFEVQIELSYRVSDARKYYFEGRLDKEDIQCAIKKAIAEYDGYWSIMQTADIERKIETAIEDKGELFKGIVFKTVNVNVVPDKAVKQMQEMTKETAVAMLAAKNNADKKINENNLEGKVLESELELKNTKINVMNSFFQKYGDLGPIVNDYLNDSLTGEQLYQYCKTEKENEIHMIGEAYNKDILPHEMATQKMAAVLERTSYQQIENTVQKNKEEQSNVAHRIEEPKIKDGDIL